MCKHQGRSLSQFTAKHQPEPIAAPAAALAHVEADSETNVNAASAIAGQKVSRPVSRNELRGDQLRKLSALQGKLGQARCKTAPEGARRRQKVARPATVAGSGLSGGGYGRELLKSQGVAAWTFDSCERTYELSRSVLGYPVQGAGLKPDSQSNAPPQHRGLQEVSVTRRVRPPSNCSIRIMRAKTGLIGPHALAGLKR